MENRRHDRYSTDFLVRIEVSGKEGVREGTCANLSRGGVFIRMDEPVPRGTSIKLQIHLKPVDEVVFTEAVVVWNRPRMPDPKFPPGVGVKFVDTSEEARRSIERAVEILSRKSRPGERLSPTDG